MVSSVIACVQVLLLCKISSCTAASMVCKDPPNLQAQYLHLNSHLLATLAGGATEQGPYQVTKYYQPQHGCPANFSSLPYKHHNSVNSRTICPWYLKCEYKTSRFPNFMLVAQGNCTNCVGIPSNCICEYVGITVMVLWRKSCVDGVYRYEPDPMFVPIASVPTRQPTYQPSDFK